MHKFDLAECFLQVRNGDREAFSAIYNEYKQPVFTVIFRIVQSKEMAEDIMQDVFVKLFTSPPDETVKNPRGWIFQIARNLSIDALRKKTHLNIEDIELIADEESEMVWFRMDIEFAMKKLPVIEREILSLYINAGLGFHEVSHIVGLSIPAVYRKYRKAIKTLQKLLGGDA